MNDDLFPPLASRIAAARARMKATAKPKRKKQPEQEIQDAIAKRLIDDGWLVVQHLSGVTRRASDAIPFPSYRVRNTGASSGLSDLSAHKNGRTLFLEIKTKTGVLQPSQKRFQALCRQCGVEYYVARSVAEIDAILQNAPKPSSATHYAQAARVMNEFIRTYDAARMTNPRNALALATLRRLAQELTEELTQFHNEKGKQ